MAWTYPAYFTSGQTLGAADLNTMQDNIALGVPVFTSEGPRDAAIVAPVEGQTCWLTNSALVTTGASSGNPGAIQFFYDGTRWCSISPIASGSTLSGTTTAAAYGATLTGDATAITVNVAPSTKIRVQAYAKAQHTTVAGGLYLGFEMRNGGSGTIVANDSTACIVNCAGINYNVALYLDELVTVSPPGSTSGIVVELQYKTTGATATFTQRSLIVTAYPT